MLEIQNLSITYQTNQSQFKAVEDLNFVQNKGEIIGLIGPSGSGKTSIIQAILQILPEESFVEGSIHASSVSYIPQDTFSSLNPSWTIGAHFYHFVKNKFPGLSSNEIHRKISDLVNSHFKRFNLKENILSQYPIQLSGGMRQRVHIILALIGDPQLIIADEPTASLDANLKNEITSYFKEINQRLGISFLIVSHDMEFVKEICTQVIFLDKGKMKEFSEKSKFFSNPTSEIAKSFLNEILLSKRMPPQRDSETLATISNISYEDILKISQIEFFKNDRIALVGPSGEGKTSLGKILAQILKVRSDLVFSKKISVQYLYQDYLGSLNPSHSVFDIIAEPLKVHVHRGSQPGIAKFSKDDIDKSVRKIISQVDLESHLLQKRPSQLSGGQQQRVALARALISTPDLLIFDEFTSAFDLKLRNLILDLLERIQNSQEISYLFITHDRQISDTFCYRQWRLSKGEITEERRSSTID